MLFFNDFVRKKNKSVNFNIFLDNEKKFLKTGNKYNFFALFFDKNKKFKKKKKKSSNLKFFNVKIKTLRKFGKKLFFSDFFFLRNIRFLFCVNTRIFQYLTNFLKKNGKIRINYRTNFFWMLPHFSKKQVQKKL